MLLPIAERSYKIKARGQKQCQCLFFIFFIIILIVDVFWGYFNLAYLQLRISFLILLCLAAKNQLYELEDSSLRDPYFRIIAYEINAFSNGIKFGKNAELTSWNEIEHIDKSFGSILITLKRGKQWSIPNIEPLFNMYD